MTVALEQLEILAVDCQATGAFPRGQLLEVGWALSSAANGADPEIESHVVAAAGPPQLPRRVRELTGLTPRELKAAPSIEQVGARLARVVGKGADGSPRVAVAHFARFEEPYLRRLLATGEDLPLDLLCTHDLARRLLPALPRRGLRAVAGYLGHAVPELRRARHHVAATLLIWRGLVSLLQERGIWNLEGLREWQAGPAPGRVPRSYPMETRIRRDLPDRPGVYRLQRTDGSVLYVGKATSVRHRVNSYFQTARGHADRTLEMLAQARAVDVTPTASALEAALLETDEIKRLRPPYNVALQEKDRRLGYWSWSLRGVALKPDDRHPFGPFPLAAPRPPLSSLLQLLDRGAGVRQMERLRANVLGVPRRYAPSLDCFRTGFDLFVRRHGFWWRCGPRVGALYGLARHLRRLRTLELDVGRAPEGDASSPRERWSAEGVARTLEEVVVRAAGVIRRARWLCALAESSVAWMPEARKERRCVVLSQGVIVARHDLTPGRAVPTPPGYAVPRCERQERIDLATYDRLSALARELRALASGGAEVEVRFGPSSALDRRALEQALQCL